MSDQAQTSAPDTPPGAQIRSPALKNNNPKAPVRLTAKKRLAAAAAAGANTNQLVKPRVTRRELKKLTEMDLEEKDDIPGLLTYHCAAYLTHVPTASAASTPAPSVKPFGEDATSSQITPSSLHDDFVNLMKAQGLEKMATEAGLMKDGALVDIKEEVEVDATAAEQSGHAKRPLSASIDDGGSPAFGSPSSGKKRKYLKINKGLRHFSMKVCQKVEEKHVTSYNEVADELVREFVTMRPNDAVYDEKNIRRRVYDALNVLMAMDIISKERKEIRWKGLPSNLQHDTEMLIAERNERRKSLEQKKQHLQDLLVQQVAMKNLLKRNAARRKAETESSAASEPGNGDEGRIFLPFIVVNTAKDTVIQCEMSEDRQDIFFNFSAPFEINDDTEILRRLNLHQCVFSELKQLVPEKLLSYLPAECEAKSEEN
ncbi:Transcription factor dp-1, partial [Globisporangium splendens]